MRRLVILGMMGLALAASAAWAQAPDGQDSGQGQRRARQREGQGQGMRGGRGMLGAGDVEQAVTLTAEQKQQVQALQEKLREQMRARMREQFGGAQGGPRDPAAFQQQRELRQQMLEAARAGDDQKVEQLRRQIDESGLSAQQRKLVAEYYDDVEKILNHDQRRQFQDWRKLQDSGVPANLLTNPQALKTALSRVELTDIQKNQVEAAFARYDTDTARLTDADTQAKQARTIELAADVVEVLKPSQKVLLGQTAFGDRGGRGDRAGRGDRGGRGGRPGGDAGQAPDGPATQQ